MDYIKTKHDCGLLRQNGTTEVGFMLAPDKSGSPLWLEFEDSILTPGYYTGAPDTSYQPPDKELPIILDDFRGGFGRRVYDSAEPKRYYYGINGDSRNGKFIMGPLATTVTKPSSPAALTITDGGLEVWTGNDLDNWTEVDDDGTVDVTDDTTNEREGTHCAALTPSGGNNKGHLYQDVDATNTYAGRTFTFTAYARPGATANWKIGINDGVNTTYSTAAATPGTWEQLSVAKTLSVATTRVRLMLAKTGTDANAGQFDGAMTLALTALTVGNPGPAVEFNEKLYVGFGRVLANLNTTTGTAFDYVAYMPATITDLKVINDPTDSIDYLYIAQGDSANLSYMTAAEVFALSAGEAVTFLTDAPGNIYGVKAGGGNKVRYATAKDTWADRTLVGKNYDDQTDLLTAPDNSIICCKEDAPYYLDSTPDDLILMSLFKTMRSSTNGKNSHTAFGKMYIQGGDQTLYEFDGTPGSATAVQTNISPSGYIDTLSEFDGAIQAITDDGKYLYIAIDNSTKIEILAGQWETINGTTDWIWHTQAELTLTGCENLFVSSVYKKRLWVFSTLSTDNVYYYSLTTQYGNIIGDTNYTFQTGGYMITPWLHGNLKNDNKAWIKVTLTMGHTYSANIYFNLEYKLWGESSWDATVVKFDGSATSMVDTQYIDVSDKPTSPFIQFRVTGVTNSTSTTPVLERIDVRAIWTPTKRHLISCSILVVDEPVMRNKQNDKITAAEIKEVLDEMAAATWPVTFYDVTGATVYVNVVQGGIRYKPIQIKTAGTSEFHIAYICELLLQKVTLT